MVQAIAPLSSLLTGFALSGQTWCYADIGAGGGYSVPPADAVWFHAVLHGGVRMTSPGGGTIELSSGDMVAVLSGDAHALRLAPDAQAPGLDFLRQEQSVDVPPAFALGRAGPVAARVLSGRLAATFPAGANRQALGSFLRLGHAPEAPWAALLRPEALAAAGTGPGSAALLTQVAALILTAHLRADPACRALFAPGRQDPIGQAIQLISGNPSANWTVERLARSVGMGRSNFAAHFTGQVGRAPMEVVAEARMEQAAQLLRGGNLKIAEISELVGYGSEAAFSRRFTRHFGQSPSQLREAARAASPAVEAPAWQPLLAGHRPQDAAEQVRRRTSRPGTTLAAGLLRALAQGDNAKG